MTERTVADANGSSPRVRGKRTSMCQGQASGRLIPACAGKTISFAGSCAPPRAHPRVCGENADELAHMSEGEGSSPRVRGKQEAIHGETAIYGLIPACAGKTSRGRPKRLERPAHPRVCGENFQPLFRAARSHGSSPRVRGKLRGPAFRCHRARLIPACAGKTRAYRSGVLLLPAHPRVCGENYTSTMGTLASEGSSPRVRGKRRREVTRSLSHRLIPACAGKTPPWSLWRRCPPAHPRVCGENGRRQ